MSDNGITKEEMAELFAKYMGEPSSGKTDTINFKEEDFKKFKDAIAQSTEQLKKATPSFSKSFDAFITGSKETSKELNRFDEAIKKASKGTADADQVKRVSALQAQKQEYQSVAAHKKVAESAVSAAKGVGDFAGSVVQGTMDFAKGLQDGTDSVVLAGQAAKTAVGASFQAAKAAAGLGSSMGDVAMMFGPIGIAIGVATKVISGLISFLADKGQKMAEQAVQALTDELEKTKKGFNDINSAGALFGGGMTEMRKTAAEAGLDITTLSTAVKASREDISMMGMGMGEGAKQVAKVSKELRGSDLGMQLRKLGFSAEEQAEMSAQVMANMNAAGDARVTNEKYVAEQTAKYGRDLRILADVTGQDAKRVAEEARKQSLNAAIVGKLNEKQRLAYEGVLRATPKEAQLALMQSVLSKGSSIADASFNIAAQANEQLGTSMKANTDMIYKGVDDIGEAQNFALKENEKIGKAQLDADKTSVDMYTASAFSATNAFVNGATQLGNVYTEIGTKQKEGATETAKKAADALATNMAPLDDATARLQDTTDKLASALGVKLIGPVTDFAKVSAKGVKTIDEALEKFGVKSNAEKAKATPTGTYTETDGGAVTGNPKLSKGGALPAGAPSAASTGTPPTAGSVPAPTTSATKSAPAPATGGTPPSTGDLAAGLTSKKTTASTEGSAGSESKLPSGTGGADWLMGMIKNHEGMSLEPYKDGLGKWTVGIGHLIGDGSSLPDAWNKKFSESEVMDLFKKDFDVHQAAASLIPGFSKLGEKAQGALTDMTFNMGPSWYNKWPNLMESLGKGDISGAVANLASSKWATQVGKRSLDDINLLKDTKVSAKEGGFTDGPDGGYNATLHGKEAIIPLSGGKTVPVTMDMSMLIHKFDEMIKVLKSQHATSEKILRVSA
jgi:GH24 family phage-related lysozyme (muramidase)